MADLKFAKYTKLILDALPHWFHMRKDSSESIGAKFLNIVGLKLDDIRANKNIRSRCYTNRLLL